MSDTTWIKLYRKIKDHEIISDPTALQIFVWILITVNYKTGKMTSSRSVASQELKIKPRTFHKALTERLQQKYNLVTLSSDNKKTIISVNNWNKYQGLSDSVGDNKTLKRGQQSDSTQAAQEIKNNKNIYTSNEVKIFSYFSFKDKMIENERVEQIAKEYDIRPKDVIYCLRDMLSKQSEKGVKIKNVKSRLNTWINNSIRWHKVATLSSKEEKNKPRLSPEDKWILKNVTIKE